MSLVTVTPDQAAQVARELFLSLHPGEQEWFDLIWDACARMAPRQLTETAWSKLPGLGAASKDTQLSEKLAKDFAVMASTFLIQSPLARQELIERLKRACLNRGYAEAVREWVTQAADEILDRSLGCVMPSVSGSGKTPIREASNLLVWDLATHDITAPKPKECSNAEVESSYWEIRAEYDLFVHQGLVFAPKASKNNDIRLQSSDYRILVALLVNKGRAIKPVPLYLLAWQQAALPPGCCEKDVLDNYLKSAVTRLRNQFEVMIEGFKIPDKRTARGYAVKGPFRTCVVLALADAEPYLNV